MTALRTIAALRLRDLASAAVFVLCLAASYVAPETLRAATETWPW